MRGNISLPVQSCSLYHPGPQHLRTTVPLRRFMTQLKKLAVTSVFAVLSLTILTGCQGLGASPGPTPTPTPAATPVGSLQSVNHIIFMMQENRSFDAYFGKINDYRASLTPALGRDADDLETDFTAPTDS